MIRFEDDQEACIREWGEYFEVKVNDCINNASVAAAARGIPFQLGMQQLARWLALAGQQVGRRSMSVPADFNHKTPEEIARAESNMNTKIIRHRVEHEMFGEED